MAGRSFDALFDQLKEFQEAEGHCNVTAKTCPDNDELRVFVRSLRKNYKQYVVGNYQSIRFCVLDGTRVAALEGIGFILAPQVTFDQRVQQLNKFKNEKGHMKIPKALNDPPYKGLGSWATDVRTVARKGRIKGVWDDGRCDEERYRLLKSMGFDFGVDHYTTNVYDYDSDMDDKARKRFRQNQIKRIKRDQRAAAMQQVYVQISSLVSMDHSSDNLHLHLVTPTEYFAHSFQRLLDPSVSDTSLPKEDQMFHSMDEVNTFPYSAVSHTSLIGLSDFECDPKDGVKKFIPYADLSVKSQEAINHRHHPQRGPPKSVYGHANPFVCPVFAAGHWKAAFKEHIKKHGVQCQDDPNYFFVELQFFLWFPYTPDFFKFHQCKGDYDCITSNIRLLGKCKDPTLPSAQLALRYRLKKTAWYKAEHQPEDFSFSKAHEKTWIWLDGDPDNILNVPFEDPSVVANHAGVMTHAYHQKLYSEGFYTKSSLASVPSVASASVAVTTTAMDDDSDEDSVLSVEGYDSSEEAVSPDQDSKPPAVKQDKNPPMCSTITPSPRSRHVAAAPTANCETRANEKASSSKSASSNATAKSPPATAHTVHVGGTSTSTNAAKPPPVKGLPSEAHASVTSSLFSPFSDAASIAISRAYECGKKASISTSTFKSTCADTAEPPPAVANTASCCEIIDLCSPVKKKQKKVLIDLCSPVKKKKKRRKKVKTTTKMNKREIGMYYSDEDPDYDVSSDEESEDIDCVE